MALSVVALLAGSFLFGLVAEVEAGSGGASAAGPALWQAAQTKAGSYEIHSRHRLPDGSPEYVNALIHESSPYLLQHAHQPVNWQSWSETARAQAKQTARPIFLSIGYATCHWCQVMARESFDDPGIARLLNRHYVSIKVDREERPELDAFYLERLELLTASPGWPANYLLTPEGQVITALSYLERDALAELLSRYARAWDENPAALRTRARAVEQRVSRAPRAATVDLGSARRELREHRQASFDPQHPGFGGEPRFFFAHFLQQQLAAWRAGGDAEDLRRYLSPLQTLLGSATHDWVSGGFFRYSVSRDWNRPHFEKRLIDQALLLPLLAEAWTISGEAAYRDAALALLARVRDSWTLPEGLLAAGQDASRDGDEGAYYLYAREERAALTQASANEASLAWQTIRRDGALPLLPTDPATRTRLRQELIEKREQKTAPALDRKVITAWNAAFFAAAAQAAPLLGVPEWQDWAAQGMKRLLQVNRPGGELARYSLQGEARGRAGAEDHAYVLLALARLYEADGAPFWMEEAETWASRWPKPRVLIEALRAAAVDRGEPSAAAVWAQGAQRWVASGRVPRLRALWQSLRPALEGLAVQSPQRHAALLGHLTQGQERLPDRVAYLADGQIQAVLRPRRDDRGSTLELELRIAPGWHINSGEPYQKYLRPTRLSLRQEVSGRLAMTYPKGEDQRLGDETLSLYSGKVTLRGEVQAPPNAHLPLELQVQACNDQVCLAPEVVVLHP